MKMIMIMVVVMIMMKLLFKIFIISFIIVIFIIIINLTAIIITTVITIVFYVFIIITASFLLSLTLLWVFKLLLLFLFSLTSLQLLSLLVQSIIMLLSSNHLLYRAFSYWTEQRILTSCFHRRRCRSTYRTHAAGHWGKPGTPRTRGTFCPSAGTRWGGRRRTAVLGRTAGTWSSLPGWLLLLEPTASRRVVLGIILSYLNILRQVDSTSFKISFSKTPFSWGINSASVWNFTWYSLTKTVMRYNRLNYLKIR